MKWWWVNHKQTRALEVGGGYLWAPRANKNHSRNQTYENLAAVGEGDVIFSYSSGKIGAVGVAVDTAVITPKPTEFGTKGAYWASTGSSINVKFVELDTPFSPKLNIDDVRPLLPKKYSPIQKNGNGNQKCYLAEISEELGRLILRSIEREGQAAYFQVRQDLHAENVGREAELDIQSDENISETEKKQLVMARRGQGLFRAKVSVIETYCRLTGVNTKAHLRASHIKPWRFATNAERLDGHNGLLLSPHVDHLFDRGYISFSGDGKLLISSALPKIVFSAWGLKDNIDVGSFSRKQKTYLKFHRDYVFRKSTIDVVI